jgi:galactofuranose transport system permease protein
VTRRPTIPFTAACARVFAWAGQQRVMVALIVLILFGALRYEHFLGAFNVLSVLRYNSMFALTSLGMCFVIMTGGIDLSVGTTAALASVVSAMLSPFGLLPGLLLVWRSAASTAFS